jgi:hypothetical protein
MSHRCVRFILSERKDIRMNTQNLIQIFVEGQEVTGAIKKGRNDDNEIEVELLSPYGGHRTCAHLPVSISDTRPARGYMYLMRDLLEDLYLQCRWDPAN